MDPKIPSEGMPGLPPIPENKKPIKQEPVIGNHRVKKANSEESIKTDHVEKETLQKNHAPSTKKPLKGVVSDPKSAVDFDIMINYVAKKGHISVDKAREHIEKGEQIAKQVLGGIPVEASSDNCRDLCWFIAASSFKEAQTPFARGMVRVMDPGNEKLYKFFESSPDSYVRISSHFKREKEGAQIGINFTKGALHDPALGTMLCGKLKDGSFFIKFEREGFDFVKDPMGAFIHSKNWFLHSVSGGGKKEVEGLPTRRETDKADVAAKKPYNLLDELKNKRVIKGSDLDKLKKLTSTSARFKMVQIIKETFKSETSGFDRQKTSMRQAGGSQAYGNEVLLTLFPKK